MKTKLFAIFNLFHPDLYYRFCRSEIDALPVGTQLFLITRRDYGTYFQLLHYIHCWEEQRGPTCLVVLTGHFGLIKQLASVICPKTKLIGTGHALTVRALAYFGAKRIHQASFAKVWARLAVDYPNGLFLYYQASCSPPPKVYSCCNYFLDKQMHTVQAPEKFVTAYKEVQKCLDGRRDTYLDMIDLHNRTTDFPDRKTRAVASLVDLQRVLPIPEVFIVMNINCKDQHNPAANRRRIVHIDRYDSLIDYLISRGYAVVLQGREEQPVFRPRPGLIDYAHSGHASGLHDLALYAGARAAILSKTGPENFAPIFNTPSLGLNYIDLMAMPIGSRSRYYPKHYIKSGKEIYWRQILQEPCYFDIGTLSLDDEVTYEEMETEELISAAEELLEIVRTDNWEYTPLQKAFRAALNPLHMDPYYIKSIPCDCYLSKSAIEPGE